MHCNQGLHEKLICAGLYGPQWDVNSWIMDFPDLSGRPLVLTEPPVNSVFCQCLLNIFRLHWFFFLFVLRAQKRDCKLATQTLRETRLLVLTIMFNYCSFQLPLISRGFVSSPSSLGGENRVRFDLQQYLKMLNVGFSYGWIIEKPTQRVFLFYFN